MTYAETIDYLYHSAPLFQQVGGAAYKPGLQVTEALDAHFDHPHRKFISIHVAGTNGKGSCAHTLAAWLQLAGLRVGLYTSPHLVDFRERIRVNGEMVPKSFVVDFVERERELLESLHPSFFEITTAMAFLYFAQAQVDVAVIEVGLGGRLDCTNILRPILSVITNISLDHTQFLGHRLGDIAREKAGIIKPDTPVVIGETLPDTRPVFEAKAREQDAPICFAEDSPEIISHAYVKGHVEGEEKNGQDWLEYHTRHHGCIRGALLGDCQVKNTNTLLHAMDRLLELLPSAWRPALESTLPDAFKKVTLLTGLRGRWEKVQSCPDVICDTGHNPGGWAYLAQRLAEASYARTHIVFGMAGDKDVESVLDLLPRTALYYFTRAQVKRAMSEEQLAEIAHRYGLAGECYPDVKTAFLAARSQAKPEDLIFVGGSSFIVADFFTEGLA